MAELKDLIALWDSPDGHPYKGRLIDRPAYEADPSNIGCMCAQGQALHLLGGWDAERLSRVEQAEADKAVAELLGISRSHAVLLRRINDSVDGAPSIVLTAPEKVLGDQAHIVLAFWRHLDRMTASQWDAAADAAWVAAVDAAGDAAWVAAGVAAGDAAGVAAGDAAWDAAWVAAGDAAWDAAADAAWVAAGDAAGAGARAAARATNEIQGARILREQGRSFYFLNAFGFADPEAVLAGETSRG